MNHDRTQISGLCGKTAFIGDHGGAPHFDENACCGVY